MKTRAYQILSTLHNLHVYFKQNSEFDKFDPAKHTVGWAAQAGALGLADRWVLSKLHGLVKSVTESFDRCRFHEGAKAIDEFIINQLSQTYVPLTRNTIWDDSQENQNARLAVYAVLKQALGQIDVMLHPLSPFVTDYLYLTCLGDKKSIILETWPTPDASFKDEKLEAAFDTMKEIMSLANAARNNAALKRRWPIREAILCLPETGILDIPGIPETLQGQLNAENYRVVKLGSGSQLAKVAGLLDNKLPVQVNVGMVRKNVAPRVKADIGKVASAFEQIDKLALIDALKSGKYRLEYDDKSVELLPSDVDVSYKALEGYSSAERGDLVVFISTTRDKELIYLGLLRDLARQLQQLRKEMQYNPTETLGTARVAGLNDEETAALEPLKERLAFLVRVKAVSLSRAALDGVSYKTVEIDGREFHISVE
jgi:isoleucyl-tRNA synthetase